MKISEPNLFQIENDYFNAFKMDNNLYAVWSIFDEGIKFGDVLPQELCKVETIENTCVAWGYKNSESFNGKTWGDLYVATSKVIENSVDSNGKQDFHIYIEGFEISEDGRTISVITGS